MPVDPASSVTSPSANAPSAAPAPSAAGVSEAARMGGSAAPAPAPVAATTSRHFPRMRPCRPRRNHQKTKNLPPFPPCHPLGGTDAISDPDGRAGARVRFCSSVTPAAAFVAGTAASSYSCHALRPTSGVQAPSEPVPAPSATAFPAADANAMDVDADGDADAQVRRMTDRCSLRTAVI